MIKALSLLKGFTLPPIKFNLLSKNAVQSFYKFIPIALTHSWPFFALITAHFIWGANFIVAKATLSEIPIYSLAFLRFLLATLLLLPFLFFDKKSLKIDLKDIPVLFVIGLMMVTLNIAFFYTGLVRTTAIEASILTMVIPVLSVLGGWWFLKEKIYLTNLFGIICGLVGSVIIIGIPLNLLGAEIFTQKMIGNLFIILASIAWVAGAILSKNMLKKYSTLTITFIIFLVGAVTFLIPALFEYFKDPLWIKQTTYLGLSGLIYITVLSSICAYFLFEWGLSKLGVVKADFFQYIEPLIATFLGVAILNEGLRFSFLAGAVLIGLGAYWGTYAKEAHKHHKAHRH